MSWFRHPQRIVWIELALITLGHDGLLLLATWILPTVHPAWTVIRHTEVHWAQARFWFQWDALWYQSIAQHGYHVGSVAFFPGVPLFLGIIGNRWVALVILQGIFMTILALLRTMLTDLGLSASTQMRVLLLFAINPAAIFYTTLYPEPFTLVGGLAGWWAFRQGRSRLAWLTAVGTALTHGTGILWGIFPLVSWLHALRHHQGYKARQAFLWGTGYAVGFANYMVYCAIRWGHPLLFLHVQSQQWHNRWTWPWTQWVVTVAHPVGIETYGLAGVSLLMVGGLWELGRMMVRRASSPLGWALLIWSVVQAVVALSFMSQIQLFHSTIRLLSGDWGIYVGWSQAPRGLYRIVLFLFAWAALFGAFLFTHHYFYQ